jgi:hypothetical integral membrane protein (TIGR02206 family)
MLQYFWSNHTDIPYDIVTKNFSPTHIAWLCAVPIIIYAILLIYRRYPLEKRNRIKRVLAVVMVCCEVSAWVWKAVIGHYTLSDMLPVHLCGISIFIELAAVFGKRTALLKEFTYSLSMPGAVSAILTPGWYYPFISFQYLQSVTLHSLLILIPVLIVWGDGFRPNYKRLGGCFLMLLFFSGIAATANALFGGNYMFLRFVPKDTTLVVFEKWFGSPGYIMPVVLLIFIVWVFMYLPWIISDRKKQRAMAASEDVTIGKAG